MRKLVGVLLFFSFSLACSLSSFAEEKPNIILIMADDLGYGDTGFTGNKIIKTPSLDKMAQEGAVMTNFHAGGSVCSPTRGTFLTGRHHHRYGVFWANVGHLPKEEITLAEILKEQGYSTGHFGKLLRAIKSAGIEDNTLVIFSSDNGPEHYAYLRDEKFNNWSSGAYRGLKRDLYEGGHRVPMIVRWPKIVPANKSTNELISQIDIMATIASIVDFKLPDDAAEDSFNQIGLWQGKEDKSARDSLVHNTFKGAYAIRRGDWSLIANKSGNQNNRMERFNYSAWLKKYGYQNDDNMKGQLFDMKNDAGQHHNLIEKNPKKANELLKLLEQIQSQGFSAPRLH